MDPRLVSTVLQQLRTRNAAEGAFRGITADYQALLQQCMELVVRPHMLLVKQGWQAAWDLWHSPLPWCLTSWALRRLRAAFLCSFYLLWMLAGAQRAAREGSTRAAG